MAVFMVLLVLGDDDWQVGLGGAKREPAATGSSAVRADRQLPRWTS